MFVTIIVPVYNEEANIFRFFDEIENSWASFSQPSPIKFQMLFIDDGSEDATWQKIKNLMGRPTAMGRVFGIRLSRNFGKELAVSAGLDRASGEAIIVMDGDLQHPPSLIYEMVSLWRQGFDVVEAVKVVTSQSKASGWCNRIFYWWFQRLTGLDLKDSTDFKLLDKKVVRAWRDLGERQVFFRGLVRWLGFSTATVHFKVPQRVIGATKFGILDLFGLGILSLTAFSRVPLRLTALSTLGFLSGWLLLSLLGLYRLFTGSSVSDSLQIMILLLFVAAILALNMTILAEYLGRVHAEVQGRPRYVIAEERSFGLLTEKRTYKED